MKLPPRSRMRFALVVLAALAAAVFVPGATLRAQNFGGPWTNLTAGGLLPLPPPPPQGDFYQVIFANPKWMVVQNRAGAQFPIATELIGQFLIRWRGDVSDLTTQVSLVEAIGSDMGSMTIQTNHIDFFMGSDMVLVKPGYVSVLPINRPATAIDPTYQRYMNAFDIAAQNTVYTWVYQTSPATGIPGQMHVVGNPVSVFPALRLGVPGNNVVSVLPSPGGFTVSHVTMGSLSYAKKGDGAFLTPVQGNGVTPKSLRIAQTVLYKNIRFAQFVP